MRRFFLAFATLATALCIAGPASAGDSFLVDSGTHSRASTLDIFIPLGGLVLDTYTHYGIGGWYAYPIVPNGFISALNDAFYIEGGAAIEHYSWSYGFLTDCSTSWWRLTPMAGARWDFNITPKFTAFATAKLGYGIGLGDAAFKCGSYNVPVKVDASAFMYNVGVGGYYRFSDSWAFRFDIGNWVAVGIGTQL